MGKKSRTQKDTQKRWGRRRESTTQAKEQVSNAARKAVRQDFPALSKLVMSCDQLQKEWGVYENKPWEWGRVKATQYGLTWFFFDGLEGLETLPATIDQFKFLNTIHAKKCTGLRTLPRAVANLAYLSELNLEGCTALAALPDAIGELKSLKSLDLSVCTALRTLPDAIGGVDGGLKFLDHITLRECTGLVALPDAIGRLPALTGLSLSKCTGLTTLPDGIGNLASLAWLHMEGCSGLVTLPDSICRLASLESLYLNDCSKLQALPASLGDLGALKDLELKDCSSLEALPDSIYQLVDLDLGHGWELHGCSSLRVLPEAYGAFTRFHRDHAQLDLSDCVRLRALPESVFAPGKICSLNVSGCSNLVALPDAVGEQSQLAYLDVSNCPGLSTLPEAICGLVDLVSLKVNGCSNLTLPIAVHSMFKLTVEGGDDVRWIPSATAASLVAASDRMRRRKLRKCVWCHKETKTFCVACGETYYCSRDHQRQHWEAGGESSHKFACAKVRKRNRRRCDVCGRVGSSEEPPYPVCDGCGARRYCGEACQLADWEAGHAQACAVAA